MPQAVIAKRPGHCEDPADSLLYNKTILRFNTRHLIGVVTFVIDTHSLCCVALTQNSPCVSNVCYINYVVTAFSPHHSNTSCRAATICVQQSEFVINLKS